MVTTGMGGGAGARKGMGGGAGAGRDRRGWQKSGRRLRGVIFLHVLSPQIDLC